MSQVRQTKLYFDITQLFLRVALSTPSGIGRVELAYAKHLMSRYPDKVRFIFALPNMIQVLPTQEVARYITAMENLWCDEDDESFKTASRVDAFLGTRFNNLTTASAKHLSRRSRRAWLMAEMIGTLAVSFAKKIGFKKLDNPTDETVFLSVSNSIVTSKWISRWLEKFKTLQTIFLLHDIIPITHPEFTLPNATRNHRQYVRRISAVSKMVIVNSEFTKKCIADYSSAESFPVPRISVAHLGVEKIFDRQYVDAFDVVAPSVPYFVFIATIEPRKNHLLLLHVWQRLTEKLGQNSPKLILIGRRGWENENALDFFERSPSVQEHVLECSQVSDRLLLKLLKGATASLFPSYIEGYGLPLAESLAVGTPVICSDIPPFREIAGDIPEFVDPLAGRGWLKLIMEYADPANPKRSRQIKRMEKFVPHRWSDHFRIVDPLIGQLLLNPDETNNS